MVDLMLVRMCLGVWSPGSQAQSLAWSMGLEDKLGHGADLKLRTVGPFGSWCVGLQLNSRCKLMPWVHMCWSWSALWNWVLLTVLSPSEGTSWLALRWLGGREGQVRWNCASYLLHCLISVHLPPCSSFLCMSDSSG